ncbi:hypothetical protein [Zooshikella harenae]|uniref:Uncharacterized protein n=1 Tax=Zooshikella harenae TaxID=2827238 RepID=A0ABS5ZHU9_9GAMM|nr:hypothetical protein [Zooshikella harenae]MBU2712861.1 hypothetical protein [Zooshikella harenae]
MNSSENSMSSSASEFLNLIDDLFEKGWHGYGPSLKDSDSLLYISFHVNPENSDVLNDLLVKCIESCNQDFWSLKRSRNNRFYLCSNTFKSKADELGSYEEAVKSLSDTGADLGEVTARELKLLTRKLAEMSK